MQRQLNSRIRRDWIIYGLIVLFFLAIISRVFYVQILQSDFLQSEGNKRQVRSLDIPAPRGHIYDRNLNVLALSTPIDSIWVDPKILSFYLDPVQQQTQWLAEGLSPEQITQQQKRIAQKTTAYHAMLKHLKVSEPSFTRKVLANQKRRFLYVQRGVLPEISQQIAELDVPGLYIQNQYKRYYPAGEVVGHLVGFTDIDDKGLAGLEKTYDEWLSGRHGTKQIIKDRAGRVVEFVKDIEPAKAGRPLVLSLDKDLQFFLYHALKKAYIQHQAESIMSVILDAKSGEVLAMVSLPSFNPNDRGQLTGSRLRNRVVTDRIEPGSTVKPFVVAKALDLGVVQLEDTFDTSPGAMRIQGERITDTRNHGVLTPGEIIQVSSNIGASQIAFKMSPSEQWQMYHDIGFGQDLGLFLPGETLGYMRPAREWQKIDQASSSFGYGFNINLMQLAQAYLIFTNQGRIKPVSLLKLKAVPEGTQVVSPEAAQAVLSMMEAVTERHGSAPQAKVDGYRVAGKTGTVHRTKIGGYEQNKYISLFAGIVPVSNPKYIMVTAINEPSRGIYYGGKVVAPIFKEVMESALRLNNVQPDEALEMVDASGETTR
ncbi:MAG: peptidoglycan D,D-transpeptidase FtsI family protein [Hydrogenovibrio sp.]